MLAARLEPRALEPASQRAAGGAGEMNAFAMGHGARRLADDDDPGISAWMRNRLRHRQEAGLRAGSAPGNPREQARQARNVGLPS